jgi:serine/threonine-protein kinase
MQTGQQIRDYVLDQKIGEGGMGEVWSATHQVLHRPVAIKAMAAHLAADPQFEQRFLDEARAQAILQHPRILGVTDFFREGGVYYLVMPLVYGRPLDDRLAEAGGPLPLGEAVAIASDLLDALDYAHQRGIIHRDVKPSNILLDRAGQAYLTDFGIALLVGQDRRTRTGTSLGTPHYMSPDQIRSPRTIDHRADVYSAACVIYEMLAGRPPFLADDGEGDTDFVLKEAHLRKDPEPIRRWNPAVPLAVDLAVLRGLAKQPDQRYGGCGEFRRALGAAAAGLTPPPLQVNPRSAPPPVPPPLPPPVYQPPLPLPVPVPRPSRSGFFWGIGLGVVLAFIALVAIGVMMAQKEEPEVEESTTTVAEESTAVPVSDPAPEPPAPEPPADYSAEVHRILERTEANLPGDYTRSADFYVDQLAVQGTKDLAATLTGGSSYTLIGQCDRNCSDLDLAIYDGDSLISEDLKEDDNPVLILNAPRSGEYRLKVSMPGCSEASCWYGIGLFVENTPSPTP